MHKLIIYLTLTLLSSLSLHAIPMHVLAWDQKIAQRNLSISAGNKSFSIENMHHFARSSPINIPAKSENLKITVNDRLSEDGVPLTIPLNIKPEITRPLLLLLHDRKSPTGIKPIILDDSPADFKWGTIRFVNLTSEELIFRYEKKNIRVRRGWQYSTVAPKGNTRNMGVTLYKRKNLKPPPIYSSIWKHRPDLRKLVFIVSSKDEERGIVDFKFITEDRAIVEAKANATPN